MRGSRPLSPEEVHKMLDTFSGLAAIRDKALFTICLNTGMRISEALSIQVRQVWEKEEPAKYLTLKASQTKVGRSRSIPLNDSARFSVAELMGWRLVTQQDCSPQSRLFKSVEGEKLTRQRAHKIITEAAHKAGLSGRVATHSMRKTAGTQMMRNGTPIPVIGEILGHNDLHSLVRYLGTGQDQIDKAVNGLRF
jgi:integrase/recombinase XerD